MPGKTSPSRLRYNCRRKIAYFSKEEAKAAADRVRAKGKLKSVSAVIYICTVCGHFHWANKQIGTRDG